MNPKIENKIKKTNALFCIFGKHFQKHKLFNSNCSAVCFTVSIDFVGVNFQSWFSICKLPSNLATRLKTKLNLSLSSSIVSRWIFIQWIISRDPHTLEMYLEKGVYLSKLTALLSVFRFPQLNLFCIGLHRMIQLKRRLW